MDGAEIRPVAPCFKGYFLVRGKDGRPKVDGDPRLLPEPIKQLMTDAEFAAAIEEWETNHADT